jgi:uncharacterized protein (TIGR02757 family)
MVKYNETKADDLKKLLDFKTNQYNTINFIHDDPVAIPHLFSSKEDIEISGFLSASIAWGQRKTILANARKLMQWMDDTPFDFIRNFKNSDLIPFRKFAHRTFNGIDCEYFLWALKNIYQNHGGMENAFCKGTSFTGQNVKDAIVRFRDIFFELDHPQRTQKHVANPANNSSAKRINMFLRWMVRNDNCGVDFGLWKKISPAQLVCPLDVHSGNVARHLGLLSGNNTNWKAAVELTENLKKFDIQDPVRYDFALFGMGIFEKI